MKQAVANERKLWKTAQAMERISRQIIFGSTSDTQRRKRLTKKVLGVNNSSAVMEAANQLALAAHLAF